MRYFIILAALFALVWAAPQDQCLCEAPICPMELKANCQCRNAAATTCWRTNLFRGKLCPPPKLANCDVFYPPAPTKVTPQPTPKPGCKCDEVMCVMSWPEGCKCQNKAAKACYKKCGGPVPQMQNCADPPPTTCQCEEKMCIQSWPEGCYCANANREECFKKCGGIPPQKMDCGTTTPPPTRQSCGGFRATPVSCPSGQVCVDDPKNLVDGGCGMSCDKAGVCVDGSAICGGFAGFQCSAGLTCVDNTSLSCSMSGGDPDCSGLCA